MIKQLDLLIKYLHRHKINSLANFKLVGCIAGKVDLGVKQPMHNVCTLCRYFDGWFIFRLNEPKHALFVINAFCIVFDNMRSMTKMPSALALLAERDRIDGF